MKRDFALSLGAPLARRMLLQRVASLVAGAVTPHAFAATARSCQLTESDILGPFYRFGAPSQTKLAPENEPGERLTIAGTVYDAN
jgi:catechol 1,2-dioxygenase